MQVPVMGWLREMRRETSLRKILFHLKISLSCRKFPHKDWRKHLRRNPYKHGRKLPHRSLHQIPRSPQPPLNPPHPKWSKWSFSTAAF